MKKFFLTVFAVLIVLSFSAPVMADVHVGGIIFNETFWDHRDEEREGNYGTAATNGINSNTKIQMHNCAHSRLYAKWNNDDGVGMYIELAISGGADALSNVSTRHAYGTWQITPNFQLLFGQTWSVFAPPTTWPGQCMGFAVTGTGGGSAFPAVAGTTAPINVGPVLTGLQAHALFLSYGNMAPNREPQLRGTFNLGSLGHVKVAVAQWDAGNTAQYLNKTAALPPENGGANGQFVQEDTVWPRLDLGAQFNFGPISIIPSFSYLNITWDQVAAGSDDDLDSWAGNLAIKGSFGAFSFLVGGNYGENTLDAAIMDSAVGPFTSIVTRQFQARPYADTAGNIHFADAECWGYFIELKYRVTPKITLAGGFGSAGVDNDMNPANAIDDFSITNHAYGVYVPIQLAKGLSLTPVVMHYEEGDWETTNPAQPEYDMGSQTIYGFQLMVRF